MQITVVRRRKFFGNTDVSSIKPRFASRVPEPVTATSVPPRGGKTSTFLPVHYPPPLAEPSLSPWPACPKKAGPLPRLPCRGPIEAISGVASTTPLFHGSLAVAPLKHRSPV